jgi:hypothetical protein
MCKNWSIRWGRCGFIDLYNGSYQGDVTFVLVANTVCVGYQNINISPYFWTTSTLLQKNFIKSGDILSIKNSMHLITRLCFFLYMI